MGKIIDIGMFTLVELKGAKINGSLELPFIIKNFRDPEGLIEALIGKEEGQEFRHEHFEVTILEVEDADAVNMDELIVEHCRCAGVCPICPFKGNCINLKTLNCEFFQ